MSGLSDRMRNLAGEDTSQGANAVEPKQDNVLVQGETYNDSSPDAPIKEEEVKTRKEKKPINKVVLYSIIGVVSAIILGAFIYVNLDSLLPAPKKDVEELVMENADLSQEMDIETVEFSYSDEDLMNLRARGYTANEIEEARSLEKDAKELIEKADKERQEYLKETMKPLLDGASPEYKKLMNNTWMGLKDNTEKIKKFKSTIPYVAHDLIRNFDYVKVPINGYQPMIKVFIDGTKHKEWVFMNVTPMRYNQLKGKGNILVKFSYLAESKVIEGGALKENKKNFFVIDIREYSDSGVGEGDFREEDKNNSPDDSGSNQGTGQELEIEE